MKNSIRTWQLLLTVIFVTFALTYLFNNLLLTKEVYYNSFGDQLDHTRIDELFNSKFTWIGFAIVPIWLSLKFFIISLCLQVGLLLCNRKLEFSETFRITIVAEFIFFIPQLLKLLWFVFYKVDYTITDVQQFYPLSALNLFKIENLSTLLIYPFQTFNVFEIFYWLLLGGGIKQALDTDINHGVRIVFSGYIPALILWVICIMFITVSLNPTA